MLDVIRDICLIQVYIYHHIESVAVIIKMLTAIIYFYMCHFHLKSEFTFTTIYWHYHHDKVIMFCKTSKLYLLNICQL